MFINSCRIFYEESSDDPIFPAQKSYDWPGFYTNQDSRARPLACIDWIDICPKHGSCYAPYDNEQDNNKYNVFARYALNKSDTYHSIRSRGATGLDAQYRIRGDTSLSLSKDYPQWIIESWNLFNTSLARIQYDAFDIANGTGSDNSLYDWKMPQSYTGKMCNMFTFQLPKDYDNIRIVPTVAIFLVPALIGLMGLDTTIEFNKKWQKRGRFQNLTLLLIEYPFWALRLEPPLTSPSSPSPPGVPPNNQVVATTQEPASDSRVPLANQTGYATFSQTDYKLPDAAQDHPGPGTQVEGGASSTIPHDTTGNRNAYALTETDSVEDLVSSPGSEFALQEQAALTDESADNPNPRQADSTLRAISSKGSRVSTSKRDRSKLPSP